MNAIGPYSWWIIIASVTIFDAEKNGRHFADGMLKYIFLIEIDIAFDLNFTKHCFLEVTIPSIGSGNGSASISRQAIIWTNDGLGPVSLKLFLTEFKFDENLILLSPKF